MINQRSIINYHLLFLSYPKSVIGYPGLAEKLDSGLKTAGMTFVLKKAGEY
jgi:hypothetical protein